MWSELLVQSDASGTGPDGPRGEGLIADVVPGGALAGAAAPADATTEPNEATIAPADAAEGTTDGSLPIPLAPTLALVAAGVLAYAGWRRT